MNTASTEPARAEFTFTDAEGIENVVYTWTPPEPVGAVQIAHGIGEHALRYEAFARYLADLGFAVYANDHRGHGQTGLRQYGGDASRLGRPGPGGLRATEAAMVQLSEIVRDRHPGLPVLLFGHSWGSLMAQRILNCNPRAWDAVVLSGSAFRTPRFMESGDLNRRWRAPEANGFEWLSRDPAQVEAYLADPLCFGADMLKLLGLVDSLRLFGRPAATVAAEVPVLIVSGGEDSLNRPGGLQRLAEAYRKRGVRDVTLKLFPGARHELLNETIRDEVFAHLGTWMLDRAAAGPVAA